MIFSTKNYHIIIRVSGIFLWLPLLLLCICSTAWSGGDIDLDELVANIQKAYEKTIDLKASFIQEATIKSIDKTLKEEGIVYFKRPQRMLWDYAVPARKKMVINPQKAWLYIPDDNIVYIQDTGKILTSTLTMRFFSGIGELKDDFKIDFAESDVADEEGNYYLSLTPNTYEAGIKKLFLTVRKDNFHITGFTFTDFYDNLTKLSFKQIQINTKLPENLFTFVPPPEVEIYKVSK